MAGEASKELYTKVYDWMLGIGFTFSEVLVFCRILAYPNGCFLSNAQLAAWLHLHIRHVRRILRTLVQKGWITCLYETKQRRILYATPKESSPGPLFDAAVEKQRDNLARRQRRDIKNEIAKVSEKWAAGGPARGLPQST